ncbi:MAG: M20/M25/M40 family metallo-hydrolase [Acidobacteria bacterium]|nr:M20/M25/M40 family metallo-hydrolase [Acidobacteriota bacterium]
MRKTYFMGALAGAVALVVCGCAQPKADPKAAQAVMNSGQLMAHIQKLASDEFEGRAPGSKGEDLTVAYLEAEFKKLGLKPGNPDGTYVQKAPLAGIDSTTTASMTIGGKKVTLTDGEDFVAGSRRFQEKVEVKDSDLVFVGYGVVAPEYGWDDYKGLDVKGKTIVMLVNDPAVPDPSDPTKLDDKMFRGRAMTYYGRWTYKYEIATEKGAAAAIIIHETGPAGYPFEVVTGSWGGENFDLQAEDNNMGRVAVEGWVSLDKAKEMFTASGLKFDDLKAAAAKKDFQPVALKGKASFTVGNKIRKVDSRNVLARIEGSDAKLKDEYVIYTAHWDHLGKDATLKGDQIYNGAVDNATGTAALLELARAFAALKPAPKRSVLFLSVTAEEQGLLGAKWYATHPLYPLNKTLANINMDATNQWGKTSDLVVVGLGNSTLDDVLAGAAKEQGRTLVPDAEPEKGFYYRSDHFEFAKEGVPALYTEPGTRFIGKPEEFSKQKREEYTTNDYHKPSDEVKTDWDLSGTLEDAKLLFEVGWRVAEGEKWPEWKPGAEFKAKREAMLQQK